MKGYTSRSIIIANILSRILAGLAFSLDIILLVLFGPSINTPVILGIGLLFLGIPRLIRYNSVAGRVLLSAIGPVLTLIAALLPKLHDTTFTDILYYDARFFLVLFAIIPCLIFDMHERVRMYALLLFIFLLIVLFDPIHEFLNVGYYQRGFTGASYYYINYVVVISFVGIVAGSLVLRSIVSQSEAQADAYLEELRANQEKLIEANAVIQNQKEDLQVQVEEATNSLRVANEELTRYNNEILQFSYAISHRLRAPLARLLGLLDVVRLEQTAGAGDVDFILSKLKSSGLEVDNVVRELNSILVIRQAEYVARELVDFHNLWINVKGALGITDSVEEAHFDVDFSLAPTMVSVQSMLYSILLNIISNALKYRSSERELKATVRTAYAANSVVLTVRDNGIGLDTMRLRDEVFDTAKTFDQNHYGKGLGLYLVKSQVDFLNGSIDVESALNEGTQFVVRIPDTESA